MGARAIKRSVKVEMRRVRSLIDARQIPALCIVVDSAGRPLACCATRDAAVRWLESPDGLKHGGQTELLDFPITV